MTWTTLAVLACLAAGSPGDEGLYARIHTERGTITVRLEPRRAPLATAAFVGLAEGTIANDAFPEGRPYYDGTLFHRVEPGHVIQAGEPASDRASDPGFTHPNEIHADLSHDRAGVLGVANAGPHTNSGQFYVTLGDRSYLDGMYIVFGEVVDGMDVVDSVREGDAVDSVRIARRGDRAEDFHPDTHSFRERVRAAEERVEAHEEERSRARKEWLQRNLPPLQGDAEGVRTAPLPEGTEVRDPMEAPPRGGPPRVRYRGTALAYWGHLLGHDGPSLEAIAFSSGPDGGPIPGGDPAAFAFEPGSTPVPEGLERVLEDLGPGEGTTAVVPASLGYGAEGFFGPEPEEPDETRFVIPPETLLVYEVIVEGEPGAGTPEPGR